MLRKILLFMAVALLVFTVSPIQADFVQCAGGLCTATVNNDLVNGTPGDDDIDGNLGDDIIFGNDGNDLIGGDALGFGDGLGNDLLFGGLGSDFFEGNGGNDTILPGPDAPEFSQGADGGDGDDTFTVLAGEVTNCLLIEGEGGNDTVNLIGFGPYSATSPFGLQDFGDGIILIIDPITNGRIYIEIFEGNDSGTETIHGMPSPNVPFFPDAGDVSDDEFEGNCPEFPFR